MSSQLRRPLLILTTFLLVGCGSSEQNGPTATDGSSAAGGAPGSGGSGSGGMGGAAISVTPIRRPVKKLDLLFMVDNSSSMADKHGILSLVIPDLVNRLVNPVCIDPNGHPVGNPQSNGTCSQGELEFDAIKDIHVGIVTSSLGAHGAGGICDDQLDMQAF